MIIDCISDLHGHYPKLEGGDLLIVAGDLTARDEDSQHQDFRKWMGEQDYRFKVFIGGNHDNYLEKCYPNPSVVPFKTGSYLCDSGAEFEGLKIWGSPWIQTFEGMNPRCKAFTKDTDEELAAKWAFVPVDTDILITHSPPYGIFDEVERVTKWGTKKIPVGSQSLLLKTAEIKPLIHCFGHIHEHGGKDLWLPWGNGTRFVNASHVNERYEPVNAPIRIVL